jgi:hypothetical protein
MIISLFMEAPKMDGGRACPAWYAQIGPAGEEAGEPAGEQDEQQERHADYVSW